jgi:hypothetical protein
VTLTVEARGLDALRAMFEQMPEIADEAARLSINDTIRFARRTGSKRVRSQVNFKAGYLGSDDSDDGALAISKYAKTGEDDAVLRAREMPTSLARFATTQPTFGRRRGGVRVKVSPGSTKAMPRAFFMKLRRGNSDITGENYNVGLAIRLRKGERIENKKRMRNIGGNLYLLYGPSVAQVFDDVAVEMLAEVSDKLASDFVRQFERLSRGQ